MAGLRPVRIDLGYNGTAFYGSQRQPGVRTVQAELESAIDQVTGRSTSLAFAGRTDRGVHAAGQVASGQVIWAGDLEKLRYALDSVTGRDLVVFAVTDVDEGFHARFSAIRRSYRYRVFENAHAPVLMSDSVWWIRDSLEPERMNEAARHLIGERDCRVFAGKGVGSGTSAESTVRRVETAEWCAVPAHLERFGRLLEFRISANAFLPHMVRNIVGAMIEVGRGNQQPDWLGALIEGRDRRNAPPPAPPQGLVLWNVEYENREDASERERSAGQEQE